jgi:hypothetical protein
MGALIIGLIAVLIFGGGYFIITLIRFTLVELHHRAMTRRHARAVLRNCMARHYSNQTF